MGDGTALYARAVHTLRGVQHLWPSKPLGLLNHRGNQNAPTGFQTPPRETVLFQGCFGCSGFLMNFRIDFSTPVKNVIWIALNL